MWLGTGALIEHNGTLSTHSCQVAKVETMARDQQAQATWQDIKAPLPLLSSLLSSPFLPQFAPHKELGCELMQIWSQLFSLILDKLATFLNTLGF